MLPCKNGKMFNRALTLICVVLIFTASLPQLSMGADLIIPEGSRIALQLNDPLSTTGNSEGDTFKAIVTAPISVGGRIAIPKGSVVTGIVSRIQRTRRFKGKASMTLLFQSINIPPRGEIPIVASLVSVDRAGGVNAEGTIEGESSTGRDAGRVLAPGLAGAGIGGLAGGGKGAGIGAGVGVAIGLATVFTSRGKEIDMKIGSALEISLDKALIVSPEGDGAAARNR